MRRAGKARVEIRLCIADAKGETKDTRMLSVAGAEHESDTEVNAELLLVTLAEILAETDEEVDWGHSVELADAEEETEADLLDVRDGDVNTSLGDMRVVEDGMGDPVLIREPDLIDGCTEAALVALWSEYGECDNKGSNCGLSESGASDSPVPSSPSSEIGLLLAAGVRCVAGALAEGTKDFVGCKDAVAERVLLSVGVFDTAEISAATSPDVSFLRISSSTMDSRWRMMTS